MMKTKLVTSNNSYSVLKYEILSSWVENTQSVLLALLYFYVKVYE